MLADADVTEEVVGDGVLPALAEGGVWLQMSTVGEGGTKRLTRLAEESGVAYVDAPVLGTKAPAEQGQLVVLASGPEGVRARCGPVFDAVGSKTVWLGEAGSGSRLKLVVNNWIAGLLGVLAETVAFARATGVDPRSFLEAIEGGPLDLPYARIKGAMMVEEDFPTSFSARLARKDAGLVLDAAARDPSPEPSPPASTRRYRPVTAKKTWPPSTTPPRTTAADGAEDQQAVRDYNREQNAGGGKS